MDPFTHDNKSRGSFPWEIIIEHECTRVWNSSAFNSRSTPFPVRRWMHDFPPRVGTFKTVYYFVRITLSLGIQLYNIEQNVKYKVGLYEITRNLISLILTLTSKMGLRERSIFIGDRVGTGEIGHIFYFGFHTNRTPNLFLIFNTDRTAIFFQCKCVNKKISKKYFKLLIKS